MAAPLWALDQQSVFARKHLKSVNIRSYCKSETMPTSQSVRSLERPKVTLGGIRESGRGSE